ncbi:MAG TPA: M12 family metallo-peptidase [Thermoanaerobaculia bacterium]|nr:M12 family metallo-peptidase [Thermoanaerobaculia bacterium]
MVNALAETPVRNGGNATNAWTEQLAYLNLPWSFPRPALRVLSKENTVRFEAGGRIYFATDAKTVEREDGTFQSFRISGEATSFITTYRGLSLGQIHVPEGTFLWEENGRGETKFLRLAPPSWTCAMPEARPGSRAVPNALPAGKRRAVRHPGPEKIVVRVAVVVTAESFAAAGGADAVHLEAQALIDQLNVIVRDSVGKDGGQPYVTFVLTGTPLVSFTPTGNATADVIALPKDPMIVAERKAEQASIVAVMTEQDNGRVIWVPESFADFDQSYGFLVFPRRYALLSYVFAHEIGHVFGMRHNPENSPGTTAIPYAYGYHNDLGEFNDIMSSYHNFRTVPLFSTTSVLWKGMAIGAPDADNARLLGEGGRFVMTYHDHLQ